MASALLATAAAHANVVLHGTRIVFPAAEQEVTLQLSNQGNVPSLIQAWMDDGEEPEKTNAPTEAEVPFVVTPTLARIDPGGQQTLRIIYSNPGQPLPADKESLFWLNVLDIPPKEADQEGTAGSLRLGFHTRIKLMYRPKGLPGKAQDAPGQLQWSMGSDASGKPVLKARNATAYVTNLGHVELKAGGTRFAAKAGYVLPGQTALFPLQKAADGQDPPATAPHTGAMVSFSSLNDWGFAEGREVELAK